MRWLVYPPVFLVLLMLPGFLAWYARPPAERPPKSIHAIRWFLGMLFLVSGIAKLLPGFPNSMGPNNLERVLAEYGLGLLGRFVAVGEVAVGFLLLTHRFATLGALSLVPMLIGILVTVISLNWIGTPYVVSGLLVLNLILLLYDYPKLLPLIDARPEARPLAALSGYRAHTAWLMGLGVLLIALGAIRVDAARAPGVLLLVSSLVALGAVDWRSR